MQPTVYHRIQILIEETNDAFSSCGTVNADFAEFAALAISDFKNILHNPQLTKYQLTKMLRSGMSEHKDGDLSTNWSTFLAQHIARTSNLNTGVSA